MVEMFLVSDLRFDLFRPDPGIPVNMPLTSFCGTEFQPCSFNNRFSNSLPRFFDIRYGWEANSTDDFVFFLFGLPSFNAARSILLISGLF